MQQLQTSAFEIESKRYFMDVMILVSRASAEGVGYIHISLVSPVNGARKPCVFS
jgi:hypothetical protein